MERGRTLLTGAGEGIRRTILDEAKELIYGERQRSYGHPFDDFSKTALIWQAIIGVPITPEQVALCLVGVKISREVNEHKRDNLVDGAGYFGTLELVRDERARRSLADRLGYPGD